MSSINKYRGVDSDGETPLYWQRAGDDAAPFRGLKPPLLREEEYEARVSRVADFHAGFFDMAVPEQYRAYCLVMERCCNGWYSLKEIVRFWRGSTAHYVEWTAVFMEDGTPTFALMGAHDG